MNQVKRLTVAIEMEKNQTEEVTHSPSSLI